MYLWESRGTGALETNGNGLWKEGFLPFRLFDVVISLMLTGGFWDAA